MPVLLIFAVLCAWEGSQWLLPAMALDPLPFAWSSAAAFGMVGVGAAVGGWRKGGWLGVWGALALGVPAMLLAVAQRYFAVEVAVAALAGVPVVVVVAAQGMGATEDGAGEALLPAVAGLAGALLLVPVRLPSSSNGWIGLGLDVLAVVLAGVFGVVAHRAAKAKSGREAVLEIAGGNAVVLAGVAGLLSVVRIARLESYAAPSVRVLAVSLGVGVLTALAAIVLLRGMPPLGFASRFLVVPLLGAVEAYAFLRPTLSFRALAGAGLMAVGAVLLLRTQRMQAGSVVPGRSSDSDVF